MHQLGEMWGHLKEDYLVDGMVELKVYEWVFGMETEMVAYLVIC